jgi:hypothetical protein
MAQFGYDLGFDLPDALAGDPVYPADLIERTWLAVGETKSQPDGARADPGRLVVLFLPADGFGCGHEEASGAVVGQAVFDGDDGRPADRGHDPVGGERLGL